MRQACWIGMVLFCVSLLAAELPSRVSDPQLAGIVAKAPPCPADLAAFGLKLRLIDYIDCTDTADPHEFMDQGTSKVVSGPAGRYRITAAHQHAFFAYRHRAPGTNTPFLLVIEYPDDADRNITVMTHDSTRPKPSHLSFSLEGGVNTGFEYPLSNRMQYFSLLNWSPDQWPPMMVFNFDQKGKSAAASRIWTYAVEEMPANPVPETGGGRVIDAFFPLCYLYQDQYFGHRYPAGSNIARSMQNIFSYYSWLGINRMTSMVYANQSWGDYCTIPSLDMKGKALDAALQELDALGGSFGYIAGFVAEGMYGDVTSGGAKVREMPPQQARAVMLKGINEFIDRYGSYRSLKGIALGSMEATGFYNMLRDKSMVADVVAEIKRRKPDWEVITYLGRPLIQNPYLADFPPADAISQWLGGHAAWSAVLAEGVRQEWQAGKHNIGLEALAVPGLQVYEMVYPDDYWAARAYVTSQPRSPIYRDIERSPEKKGLVRTPYAGIFSYFNEGSSGLEPGYNFWYGKRYTGPDVNPAGPLSMAAFALALAGEDRLEISFGSWGLKSIGYEAYLRRFAAAFRSLPPKIMQDVEISGTDTLKVRTVVDEGKRHLAVLNLTPFAHGVTVGGEALLLDPYELRAFHFAGSGEVPVLASRPQAYANWVQNRITQYRTRYEALQRLSAEAAPARFLEPADQAEQLFKKGRLLAADIAIGHGLLNELAYRTDILSPPSLRVPAVPSFDHTRPLQEWPETCAVLVRDQAEDLLGHVFAPASWHGPADLSAHAKIAHDDNFLYIGIDLRDDVCDPTGDDLHVCISKNGYRDFVKESVPYDKHWTFPLGALPRGRQTPDGADIAWQRDATGYTVSLKIKLPEGVKDRMGLMMYYGDRDKMPNLDSGADGKKVVEWVRKQFLGFSGRQNHPFWADARNCMELVLAQ